MSRAPTRADLDALARYADVFERPGFVFGDWQKPVPEPGDAPDLAPEVDDFVRDLYKRGFLAEGDWTAWRAEAQRLYDDPEALAKADVEALRRAFAVMLRQDRFGGALLLGLLRTGVVARMLRRAGELRDGLPPS